MGRRRDRAAICRTIKVIVSAPAGGLSRGWRRLPQPAPPAIVKTEQLPSQPFFVERAFLSEPVIGKAELPRLGSVEHITRLDIASHNPDANAGITDEVIDALSRSPLASSLAALAISPNSRLTDASIDALNRFRKLKSLDLPYHQITESGTSRLALADLESLNLRNPHEDRQNGEDTKRFNQRKSAATLRLSESRHQGASRDLLEPQVRRPYVGLKKTCCSPAESVIAAPAYSTVTAPCATTTASRGNRRFSVEESCAGRAVTSSRE